MDSSRIIHDVDVSMCLNFEEKRNIVKNEHVIQMKDFCVLWSNSCNSINNCNCYYKMWQRSEQKLNEINEVCNEHYKTMEYWQDYSDQERTEKYIAECARHNLAHEILCITRKGES